MMNRELDSLMTMNDTVFTLSSFPAWVREKIERGAPGQWVPFPGTIYVRRTADPLDPGNMVEMLLYVTEVQS